MRKSKYYGPINRPSSRINYHPLSEDQVAKEISDILYDEYKYDLNYIHINKLIETILFTSYFYFDYKDYKEVIDNLYKDMYNIKYINALLIAFISKYNIIFYEKGKVIIEYEDESELKGATIIILINCILNYIKEKDIDIKSINRSEL